MKPVNAIRTTVVLLMVVVAMAIVTMFFLPIIAHGAPAVTAGATVHSTPDNVQPAIEAGELQPADARVQ